MRGVSCHPLRRGSFCGRHRGGRVGRGGFGTVRREEISLRVKKLALGYWRLTETDMAAAESLAWV